MTSPQKIRMTCKVKLTRESRMETIVFNKLQSLEKCWLCLGPCGNDSDFDNPIESDPTRLKHGSRKVYNLFRKNGLSCNFDDNSEDENSTYFLCSSCSKIVNDLEELLETVERLEKVIKGNVESLKKTRERNIVQRTGEEQKVLRTWETSKVDDFCDNEDEDRLPVLDFFPIVKEEVVEDPNDDGGYEDLMISQLLAEGIQDDWQEDGEIDDRDPDFLIGQDEATSSTSKKKKSGGRSILAGEILPATVISGSGGRKKERRSRIEKSSETSTAKYSCPRCGKSFTRKDSAIGHQIMICKIPIDPEQLGRCNIKIYHCEFPGCDAIRTKQSAMMSHNLTHKNRKVRPFKCEKCGARFTRQDSVFKHLRGYCKAGLIQQGADSHSSSSESKEESKSTVAAIQDRDHGQDQQNELKTELPPATIKQDHDQQNDLKTDANLDSIEREIKQIEQIVDTVDDIGEMSEDDEDEDETTGSIEDDRNDPDFILDDDIQFDEEVEDQGEGDEDYQDLQRELKPTTIISGSGPSGVRSDCTEEELRELLLTPTMIIGGTGQKKSNRPSEKDKTKGPWTCTECKRTFTKKDTLYTHMIAVCKLKVDPEELGGLHIKLFGCDVANCKAMFPRVGALIKHKRTHTKAKPFKCTQCESSFTRIDSLRLHLRSYCAKIPGKVVRKVKKYAKKVKPKASKEDDSTQKESKLTFQCHYCDRIFKNRFPFNKHLEWHKEGKDVKRPTEKVTCELCGRRMNSYELPRHKQRSHENLRPHKCPHCDRAFYRKEARDNHVKVIHETDPNAPKEEKEKTFICETCAKGFTTCGGLYDHQRRVHLKVTRFQCRGCGMGFYHKNDLRKHERSHGISETRIDTNTNSSENVN